MWGQPTELELTEYAYRCVESALLRTDAPVEPGKSKPLGVFVTVEIGGQVVACRGSLVASQITLEQEIARQALSAAKHDPRYGPVQLKGRKFAVTLTLVDKLEPYLPDFGPEKGLVLTQGPKVGVVLPWEGKDPAVRLQWAYKKASVPEGRQVRLQLMSARRNRFPVQ